MKQEPTEDRVWTAQHDLIVRIVSPMMAAEKLGRTINAVMARRDVLGLTKFDAGRKPSGPSPGLRT
jgi:hypothetical protein